MKKFDGIDLLGGGEDEADIHAIDEAIYGSGLSGASGGTMRAKRLNLMRVRPDVAQPRRAIPLGIRGGWDGDPSMVSTLLDLWRQYAEREFRHSLDVVGMLSETSVTIEGDHGHEVKDYIHDDLSPIAKGFIDLVQLAADINRVGLTQPITVARDGDGYLIIAGERRYLAHHLLYQYVDEATRIPAFVKDSHDVWAQASENANRSPLNAIGMARQVALLMMAMHREVNGTEFRSFAEMVKPGESDRAFYAQVADGREFRVLSGYAEKLTTATGLPSYGRVRRYRALLSVPDELWIQADSGDWSERKIRDAISPPRPSVPMGTLREESFEQATPDRIEEHHNARSMPPRQYSDDTWDDDGDDFGTDDMDRVSPAPTVRKMDIEPWLDGRHQALLYHLNEIVKLYAEDGLSPDDAENLKMACVYFRTRNDSDAPKPQELMHFAKHVNYHLGNYKPLIDLLASQLNEMARYLVKRSEEQAGG
jgi:hypothetical protein